MAINPEILEQRTRRRRQYDSCGSVVDEMDRLYAIEQRIEELQDEAQARRDRIYDTLHPRRERAVLLSRAYTNQVYTITFPYTYAIDYTVDEVTT